MIILSKVFANQIALIQDAVLRKLVSDFLDECVPDYFATIPASSSGKYHPDYSLGIGGLVRHTKAAVLIAKDLLELQQNNLLYTTSHDIIIASLIIHDTFKHGYSENHTLFEHPLIAAHHFYSFALGRLADDADDYKDDVKRIADCVSSHMGEWNVDASSGDVLPVPKTDEQKFVHQCDYLASRRHISVGVYDETR